MWLEKQVLDAVKNSGAANLADGLKIYREFIHRGTLSPTDNKISDSNGFC